MLGVTAGPSTIGCGTISIASAEAMAKAAKAS